MREIEFRGQKYNGRKWVYGGYSYDAERNIYTIWEITKEGHNYGLTVIPETIGQYTGLKDKNGVKIFEGDIVEWQHRTAKYKRGKILFRDAAYWIDYLDKDEDEYLLLENLYDIEVIGNIHDNPELLEAE